MTKQRPEGEFEFIARRLRPLATEQGALNLSDDAALLTPTPGHELVITTDTLVADVHFRHTDPLDLIAQKSLLVNLSDLASKGATPRCYFLQIVWPASMGAPARSQFVDGLAAVQTRYDISLIGGDTTTSTGPLTISVTMIGQVKHGQMVVRGGAKVGDDLWVTGTIGDAALALQFDDDAFQKLYLTPNPPVLFGTDLYDCAHAALDISDGLVADAHHMAHQSEKHLVIEADKIPLSGATRARVNNEILISVLTGGDDYQILFAAPRVNRESIAALADKTGTQLTKIGHVLAGPSCVTVFLNGTEMHVGAGGYTHF